MERVHGSFRFELPELSPTEIRLAAAIAERLDAAVPSGFRVHAHLGWVFLYQGEEWHVGVLSGLMWLPFSGLIRHWVGLFHGIVRTALVVAAWYRFPHARFVAIPIVIVAVYLVTIVVLVRRGAVSSGSRIGSALT